MERLISLKDVPLWLMIGFAAVSTYVWQTPTLQQGLPEQITSSLPLASIGLWTLASLGVANRIMHLVSLRYRDRATKARERLMKVYRPIHALFLDRHVTSSSAILAPRIGDRLRNARKKLRGQRYSLRRLELASRALGDRGVLTSAEVEYGGEFPLHEIKGIALANLEQADERLLSLIRRADRSRYEEPGQSVLTDEEFALFNHIHAEHKRLSRWA